jgi:hypothetical protein
MAPEALVQELADRMPRRLRVMRAKMMLEQCHETLGVREVPCPACRGTGWADREALRTCPICVAFREVPEPLAQWYTDEVAARRAPRRPAEPATVVPEPIWRARAEREVHSTRPERLGRAARRVAHLHLPER